MKKILFFLLLLCSIHFWGFVYIPQGVNNITNAISLLIMGISLVKVINKKGLHFKTPVIIFLAGLFLNIIVAYINHGQSPVDSFLAFGSFYFVLFYFTLHEMELDRKYLENIIIIFALVYSVFYIVQVIAYPRPIFTTDLHVDRGTIRLRIEGNGFLVLAFFLLLNRYLIDQKLKNVFLMGFFFIILLKGGFRTLTFAVLILTVFMYFKLIRYAVKNYLTIILAMLFVIGLAQSRGTSAIFKKMIYTTQAQKEEGDNYIRMRQLEYFFKRYPENASYYIFGGGIPAGDGYNVQKMTYIVQTQGFYFVDLGLMGFYIVIGAVATLGIVWFALRAIMFKMKPWNLYLNFYFLYLFLVSFTTMEIYRAGIFAVEAIALYLIDLSAKEESISVDASKTKSLPIS